MKNMLQTITLLLCIFPLLAWSDTPDDRIGWIKQEYKNIRTNLNAYKKQEYNFTGDSAEGAGGIGYLSDTNKIKLIEVTYYGETGKVYFEFYYTNKNTFFIFEKKFTYNTHFSMTDELVKEWYKEDGVFHEAFDLNKTKVEEWRYYIYEKIIIKTLGPKGAIVSNSGNAESALELSLSNYERLNKIIQLMSKNSEIN